MLTKTPQRTYPEETHLVGKVVDMTVAPEAMGHIVQRLTDIYADPLVAAVREVVSNAQDATKAAGSDRLVEVSSPTHSDPHLTVIDHGTGMAPDTMESIYLTYGVSTKSTDMGQVGAYGLGAKAPLAYSNRFQVTSVQGGVKTFAEIYLDDTGPHANVRTASTGEQDGTIVRILVQGKDFEKVNETLASYSKYGGMSPIVINGITYDTCKDLVYVGEVVLDAVSGVKGGLWVRDPYTVGDGIPSLIDNVIHRWEDPDLVLCGYRYNYKGDRGGYSRLTVQIEPGVVDFPSSRDTIINNSRLTDLVGSVKNQAAEGDLLTRLRAIHVSHQKPCNVHKAAEGSMMLAHKDGTMSLDGEVFDPALLDGPMGVDASKVMREPGNVFATVRLDKYERKCFTQVVDDYDGGETDVPYPIVAGDIYSVSVLKPKVKAAFTKGAGVSALSFVAGMKYDPLRPILVGCSSERDVEHVIRWRQEILNTYGSKVNLFMVRGTPTLSDADEAHRHLWDPNDTLRAMTATELLDSVGATGKKSQATERMFDGVTLFDNRHETVVAPREVTDPSAIYRFGCNSEDASSTRNTLTFRDVTSDPNTLILIDNNPIYSDVKDVLNGYLHAEGDRALEGKRLVQGKSLTKTLLSAVPKERILVGSDPRVRDKNLLKSLDDRRFRLDHKFDHMLAQDKAMMMVAALKRHRCRTQAFLPHLVTKETYPHLWEMNQILGAVNKHYGEKVFISDSRVKYGRVMGEENAAWVETIISMENSSEWSSTGLFHVVNDVRTYYRGMPQRVVNAVMGEFEAECQKILDKGHRRVKADMEALEDESMVEMFRKKQSIITEQV